MFQLLMKPIDYGLVSDKVDNVAQRNLSVLSTIFIYIIRKVSVPSGKPMLVSMGLQLFDVQ